MPYETKAIRNLLNQEWGANRQQLLWIRRMLIRSNIEYYFQYNSNHTAQRITTGAHHRTCTINSVLNEADETTLSPRRMTLTLS